MGLRRRIFGGESGPIREQRVDCPICGEFLTTPGVDPAEPWAYMLYTEPAPEGHAVSFVRQARVAVHLRCVQDKTKAL